jgi:hypothetical protein
MNRCAWMQNLEARSRVFTIAGFPFLPELAMAQASPFLTGANALQTDILAWLTPIAIIFVMVLGHRAPRLRYLAA